LKSSETTYARDLTDLAARHAELPALIAEAGGGERPAPEDREPAGSR
jgi:hypothetical protein